MIISRELDYAVRIIRQLNKTKISNAAQIEKTECMSRDFARKILGKLKKAGIVSAERGTNGGYYLEVSPETLTLWDLKNAIEPGPMVNKCMREDFMCPRNCDVPCAMHTECMRIEALIESELKSKSLDQLI